MSTDGIFPFSPQHPFHRFYHLNAAKILCKICGKVADLSDFKFHFKHRERYAGGSGERLCPRCFTSDFQSMEMHIWNFLCSDGYEHLMISKRDGRLPDAAQYGGVSCRTNSRLVSDPKR
jgi:hypothetical protein